QIVGAPHLLAPRPGRLALRQFAPRRAGIFLQLIRAIERGRIDRGVEIYAYAVAVDRRLLAQHALQHVLVDAAADQYDDTVQPAGVEDGAHLARLRSEVAGVDAHAANGDAVGRKLGRERDDFARAGFGIVGVDQEDHAVRPRAREILERLRFVVVHLHEGMRHGADDRHAVARSGFHVGGAGKAGEVAR